MPGLLGAMIRLRRGIPFVLTEHGIYTKERKIDLAQATWLHDHNDDVCNTLHDEMGYIRGLWIRFYEQIGRMAYGQASPIVSLYEGNRQRQIADGAAAVLLIYIVGLTQVAKAEGGSLLAAWPLAARAQPIARP